MKDEAIAFRVIYARKLNLNGYLDDIDVGVVEREATPKLFMKLDMQLNRAILSFLNTISILYLFSVERHVLQLTTRFTRPIDSPRLVAVWITWSLRP